jgi:hypothetical protein
MIIMKKKPGKKTPENADAELLKYVEAHRKLVDSGIDWMSRSIRLGLIMTNTESLL